LVKETDRDNPIGQKEQKLSEIHLRKSRRDLPWKTQQEKGR
jgi:hypothetical protein